MFHLSSRWNDDITTTTSTSCSLLKTLQSRVQRQDFQESKQLCTSKKFISISDEITLKARRDLLRSLRRYSKVTSESSLANQRSVTCDESRNKLKTRLQSAHRTPLYLWHQSRSYILNHTTIKLKHIKFMNKHVSRTAALASARFKRKSLIY